MSNEEIQWKIWKVSKCSGGLYGNAHKGDVWECSNIGGLVRKNGVIQETFPIEENTMTGYLRLKCGYRVHKIIAETWVENDDPINKNYVDHIDGNKLNNNASNLRWVTHVENMLNPLTRKHISDSKKLYKFTDEHKSNISEGNINSYNKLTDKQKRIRYNSFIRGIYLRLNKETNKYDYYNKRYHGDKLSEEEVNKILNSQGYDNQAVKIQ